MTDVQEDASDLVLDPALAYMKAFHQCADRQELKAALLSRYDAVMVCPAKDALCSACQQAVDEFKMEKIRRRDTSSRSQPEADLDDIHDALEKLDAQSLIPNFFCAVNDLLYLRPAIPAVTVSAEVSKEVGEILTGINTNITDLSSRNIVQTGSKDAYDKHTSSQSHQRLRSPHAAIWSEESSLRSNIVVFNVPESSSLVDAKSEKKKKKRRRNIEGVCVDGLVASCR